MVILLKHTYPLYNMLHTHTRTPPLVLLSKVRFDDHPEYRRACTEVLVLAQYRHAVLTSNIAIYNIGVPVLRY